MKPHPANGKYLVGRFYDLQDVQFVADDIGTYRDRFEDLVSNLGLIRDEANKSVVSYQPAPDDSMLSHLYRVVYFHSLVEVSIAAGFLSIEDVVPEMTQLLEQPSYLTLCNDYLRNPLPQRLRARVIDQNAEIVQYDEWVSQEDFYFFLSDIVDHFFDPEWQSLIEFANQYATAERKYRKFLSILVNPRNFLELLSSEGLHSNHSERSAILLLERIASEIPELFRFHFASADINKALLFGSKIGANKNRNYWRLFDDPSILVRSMFSPAAGYFPQFLYDSFFALHELEKKLAPERVRFRDENTYTEILGLLRMASNESLRESNVLKEVLAQSTTQPTQSNFEERPQLEQ